MKPLTADELDVLARMAAIDLPISAVQAGKRADLLPALVKKRAVVATGVDQWALTRFGKWHGEGRLKTLEGSHDHYWAETRLSARN
ncbi:MAG: hypothetical protein GY745_02215 [Actinomycetia bacterium]|nr:hypothetical protein [Actinomycetes bacterium]MCP4083864.1 hypothetical protein [Actinomycetes bacterium]